MILSPNLAPRTHRDLPGRYTAEGNQVALPVLSHSSDCSASRAPPGLKPQPGWPAPARCSQAHPAADSHRPKPGRPQQVWGYRANLRSCRLASAHNRLGFLPRSPVGSRRRASLFQEAVAIAGEKKAPGREAIASRIVAPGPAPARQLTSVSRSAAMDLAPRPGQASAGARLARGE